MTWEIIYVAAHDSPNLNKVLEDGWEPFAATTGGGVVVYHLKRPKPVDYEQISQSVDEALRIGSERR